MDRSHQPVWPGLSLRQRRVRHWGTNEVAHQELGLTELPNHNNQSLLGSPASGHTGLTHTPEVQHRSPPTSQPINTTYPPVPFTVATGLPTILRLTWISDTRVEFTICGVPLSFMGTPQGKVSLEGRTCPGFFSLYFLVTKRVVNSTSTI